MSAKSNKKIYNKQYYDLHKDDRKIKTTCVICNGTYNMNSKYYHNKSKKHLNALALHEKDKQIDELCNKLKSVK
ncbi:hypothetical protein Klosneuvirus_3_111 [Klosneuvirus KNV1]|uniref:Uncharacterized protein n=1 Tax=Klosneuvirus KNV1 TaxID=1977640 RepID=A0A1V0SJT2_9VIRU|nr:hypothetical protein Klosneuvirus_3_111 [Klosneuvirus KNV1]